MSSTTGDVIDDENYPTCSWVVRRLMEKLELPAGLWYEPCAGEGAIIKAVNRPDVRWLAREIREECRAPLSAISKVHIASCLDHPAPENVQVIISNTPFSLAQRIAEHFRDSPALLILLQRLNWLAGPRRELIRLERPSVYVLPDRPSYVDTFYEDTGKLEVTTDSIEYAWFVFDGNAKIHMLDDTPLEVRSAEVLETRQAGTRPRRIVKSKGKK